MILTEISETRLLITVDYLYDNGGNPYKIIVNNNGYYHDVDFGMYYLGSRFYDAEICRFVNADGQLNMSANLLGVNQYTYCVNNPVVYVDESGTRPVAGTSLDDETAAERSVSLSYTNNLYGKNTDKDTKTVAGNKKEEIESYAATVYTEAGGQNKRTKQAVAHVMNNRIGTREAWSNLISVISDKSQFNGYGSPMYQDAMYYYQNGTWENAIERQSMDECMEVVVAIYAGVEEDITEGCMHFYSPISMNPPGSQPNWVEGKTEVIISGINSWYFRFFK